MIRACVRPAEVASDSRLFDLDVQPLHLFFGLGKLGRYRRLELLGSNTLSRLTPVGFEPLLHLRGIHTVAHDAIDRIEDPARRSRGRLESVAIGYLESRKTLFGNRREVRHGRYASKA